MPRPQPLFQMHRLLASAPRGVSLSRILSTLRISRPTAFRLFKELREAFNAPIEFDRQSQTYRYANKNTLELPGTWLNHDEWTLLLGLVQSLGRGEKGPLKSLMPGLREKLSLWSSRLGEDITQWRDKVRFVPMGERVVSEGLLQCTLSALHSNRRMVIQYRSALSGMEMKKEMEIESETTRIISPIRLVRYRDNWYIDAHCHLRNALRSFSLSQIITAKVVDESAIKVNEAEGERFFTEAYGIFSGKAKYQAKIRFHGIAARLASREAWHPKQVAEWLPEGHWQVRFPFGDSRELVRDLCRWADGLVAIEPVHLKTEVTQILGQGLKALQPAPSAPKPKKHSPRG